MLIRRDLAPLGIALALGAVMLVQIVRSGGAGTPTAGPASSLADPCQSLVDVPNAAFMATPIPAQSGDQALATISTNLAVSASADGAIRLRSAQNIEEPVHHLVESASSQGRLPDAIDLMSAFLLGGQDLAAPNWDILEQLLRVDDREDPGDIGLFDAALPPIADQIATITAANQQRNPDQRPDVTPVALSGVTNRLVVPPYDEFKAASAAASTQTDLFVSDTSGPPIIYANGDKVFVHLRQVDKQLEGGQIWAGGWTVKPENGGITASITALPVNASWHAAICIDGMQFVTANPPPKAMNGNLVTWSYDPPADGRRIDVTVSAEPNRAAWLRQWISSRGRASIVLSWALLTPALLLLAGLWSARQAGHSAPPVEAARARLNGAVIAVVKLAIAGVMVTLLQVTEPAGACVFGYQVPDILLLGLSLTVLGFEFVGSSLVRNCAPRWRGLTGMATLAFIIAVAGVVLIAYANSPYVIYHVNPCDGVAMDFRREGVAMWSPLERSLLVAGYFTFIATAITMWKTPLLPELGSWRAWFLVGMLGIGLMLCAYDLLGMQQFGMADWMDDAVAVLTPLWVTSCVVIGFVLLTAELLPMQLTRLERTPIGRFHVVLAIAIVLGAILIQWVAVLYSQQPLPARMQLEADPLLHLRQVYADEMQVHVAGYLNAFLIQALNLLPLLGLAGLIGMLSAAALREVAMHQSADLTWIERVLRFLFAAFVIGYGGSVLGLRAPVAFLIGLVLLPLAWSTRGNTSLNPTDAEPAAVNRDPPTARPPTPGERRMTHARRAAAVAAVSAKRDATVKHPATNGQTPQQSITGDYADQATCPETPVAEWWMRGALATRLGSGLAIAPVAFFVYLFVTDSRTGPWTSESPFAMASFVTTIAYEVAFWLVAAFVFGCMLPYLRGDNGLIKGLVLAAIYVGANATAAIVGVSGDALWRVRSFQLVLFLILLGVWIDRLSLPAEKQSWQGLWEHYDLGNATAWVKHVLPLTSALAAVAIQLLHNNTQDAITDLIQGQSHDEILKFACLVVGQSAC